MENSMNENTVGVVMPQYVSHKKVWALKIADIEVVVDDGGKAASAIMRFAEPGYGARPVSGAYMAKHAPQVGGYFVVYPDGYESWSPAKAFEDGYERITP